MERWFLATAAAVTAAAALTAACGNEAARTAAPSPTPTPDHAPRTATMDCSAGFGFADRPTYRDAPEDPDTVHAGPLAILWLRGHARIPPDFFRPGPEGARRPLHTKVLLAPRRSVTIQIAPQDRERVTLSTQFYNQDVVHAAGEATAVRLEGCPPRPQPEPHRGTGFAVTVIVAAPGCATFEITPEGEPTMHRTVGFGAKDCA